jgi:RNA polymerase sigma factor (sigma-70 family)
MANGQLPGIIDQLRRLVGRQSGCALTDAQLLEAFVSRRDEAAFEVLVWRHGAMVLRLCQRILRDAHEAEDAFQATFLVFARKAGAIGKRESVSSWLHKVAYRVALRVRARSVKRGAQQELADDVPAREPADDLVWRDLRPILDQEIDRLPEKYRAPFVLCYLESHTNEEAAEQLGCPKGTVLSRLARGRERLRSRLARRGVALSAGWIATVVAQNAAAMPPALVNATVKAAIPFAAGNAAAGLVPASVAALTEGVLHAMFLTKLKVAGLTVTLLAFVAVVPGVGLFGHGAQAERPAPGRQATLPERPAEKADRATVDRPEADSEKTDREPAHADEKPTVVTGRVVAVAQEGKSFTVFVPGFASRDRSREVEGKKINVKIGDKTTVLYHVVGPNGAKPTSGYAAQVEFEKGKDVAASVTFRGSVDPFRRAADLLARVAGVSKDGKTITLQQPRRSRAEDARSIDVKMEEKTHVVFHNVAPDGARIAEGLHARVWLKENSKDSAEAVHFIGTQEGQRRGEKGPDVAGVVVKVARDGKSITVVTTLRPRVADEEPKKAEIKLEDRTVTVYHNVPPGGAKLAAGLLARVWLKEDSSDSAARVSFTGVAREKGTMVAGKVVGVSKDGKTITLEQRGRGRDDQTPRLAIKIADKTRVGYTGIGPGEAKPTEGYFAQVRLAEGSKDTAAGILFGKPGERRR